jgi:hypothetical protein
MDGAGSSHTPIARGWAPRWARWTAGALAVAYLVVLALANTGLRLAQQLPPVPRYFTQVACLFPQAGIAAIEYRAEGWSCAERTWVEIDHRSDFPLHAENKESRFHRVGQFYRRNLQVMEALDAYLVERHNSRHRESPIGGIQFLSLRIPLPPVGGEAPRYGWRSLSDYPPEIRKEWYRTVKARRDERCAGAP